MPMYKQMVMPPCVTDSNEETETKVMDTLSDLLFAVVLTEIDTENGSS